MIILSHNLLIFCFRFRAYCTIFKIIYSVVFIQYLPRNGRICYRKKQVQLDANNQKSGRKKTRKYNSSYLNFDITVAEKEGAEHPQCVICYKVLAAKCVLPIKLKHHLITNHNNLSGKLCKFFACKLTEMNKQSVEISSFLDTPVKAQLASFKVAYRIAKCKKPHTIVEEFVLSAALDLVSRMIGESVTQKLKVVSLSNNTICRRIEKIFDGINNQLIAKMRGNEFSLQLDEATTSTSDKDAYLICYICFIDSDDNIVEDLLFCKLILTNCKAHQLFAILNNFYQENKLSGNIALVYALMEPELCLVILVDCKHYACRALPLEQNGPPV